MRWLCRLIGHGCRTVQSKEICSFIPDNSWFWPGVITWCPRCGMIYKHMGAEPSAPWFAPEKTDG
jgi:hypothetical protein